MSHAPSPLGDLALVGATCLLALAAALALAGLALGRPRLARGAAALAAALVGLYALALLGVAFASRERVLPPGAEKSVSGFDPHLHFKVAGPAQRGPDGTLTVRLDARSDAARSVQRLDRLSAALVDERGRRWSPEPPPPLVGSLAPGETTVAAFRFRPAPDAAGLRLLVTERGWPLALTIGHEVSPFHRKVLFALEGL
jgi:hypothetical protein